jgi:branched-chain amino acid transport system ATP-binding protein
MKRYGQLSVEGLTLSFGALTVLSDVSFEVAPGSVHGLIGPNGAGKSSCFNVISGLYQPSQGSVRLDGVDFTSLAPHRRVRHGLGRSFQNTALAGDRTVFDNLRLGRHTLTGSNVLQDAFRTPRLRRERRSDDVRLREIADFMGITAHLDTPVRALPYGVQKRVDMARAVATEPRILLLDEPAAGMGPSETSEVAAAVRAINTALDISVLVVEHDMGFVMGVCEDITVLNFGQVIARGGPDQVRSDPAVIHSYLGSAFDSVDEAVRDLAQQETPT